MSKLKDNVVVRLKNNKVVTIYGVTKDGYMGERTVDDAYIDWVDFTDDDIKEIIYIS